MSSFLLPDELCHKLDMAFKNLWWGFPKDKSHNLSLKSWNSLCLPKDQGGLGFRLMKDINISLISKLGWNLLVDHDCLWVSLFKNKYFKYGNLLTSALPIGSFIWNGIKSIVPLLKSRACFIPHLFSSLAIWFSPWVPTLPGFRPVPRVESLQANFPLAILDLLSSATGTWNLPLLRFLFEPSSVSKILKIKIRSATEALLWSPSSTSVFYTKSAHRFLTFQRTSLSSPLQQSSWKLLWKLKLNHRLRLFFFFFFYGKWFGIFFPQRSIFLRLFFLLLFLILHVPCVLFLQIPWFTYFSLAPLLGWSGEILSGLWIFLLCVSLLWLIGYILYFTHRLLVFLHLTLIFSKSLQ